MTQCVTVPGARGDEIVIIRPRTAEHIDLARLVLSGGSHEDRRDGLCLLEAVAWFAGEPHSDYPACTSSILGLFGRRLNDVLSDHKRQRLVPYVPRLVGTYGDGRDETRGYIALDWLIRTYTPAWLDLAGLTAEAQVLRDLRRIVDRPASQTAGPVVRAGQAKADAAWDAARDAAGPAAGWATVWDAARDAAAAAAYATARIAAGPAAGAAAWAAAWVAGGPRLAPTVDQLQDSAIDLFDALIRGEFPAVATV